LPPTTTSTTVPAESAWDRVLADPELSEFAEAVEIAGLVDLLDGQPTEPPDPDAEFVTVLAPTNEAIEAIANWEEINADPAAIDRFVLAHLVEGTLTVADILAVSEVISLSTDELAVDPDAQTINGARFVTVDQTALNGNLHSVDGVLVVPSLTPPTTIPAPPETAPPAPETPPPAPETPPPPPDTSAG